MVEVIRPVDDVTIYQGHVIEGLRLMPDKSVQCVVTSDPYWGLRSYGADVWEGGNPGCDHAARDWDGPKQTGAARSGHAAKADRLDRDTCAKCGAQRRDTQAVDWPEATYSPMAGVPPITVPTWNGPYGLEPTPEMYVGHSVLIRRELWRVMRDDGVQWLNLGDSYNGSGGAGGDYGPGGLKEGQPKYPGRRVDGLKPKDLCGIPWRVAFALQADGWYLRSGVIWHKPAPMPESVTDRPTKSHENVFLLTKGPRYFYDADAIREPHAEVSMQRVQPHRAHPGRSEREGAVARPDGGSNTLNLAQMCHPAGRNKRDVWTISTTPFPEAHFAVFPEELPETCILAGTSPQACPHCGAPWERMVERQSASADNPRDWQGVPEMQSNRSHRQEPKKKGAVGTPTITDKGWQPTCSCEDNDGSGKCIALDLFHGSGTSMRMALKHHRSYIGCELNPEYVQMSIRTRLHNLQTSLLGMA